MLQRPTAVGLFVCDQLIVEEGTKNLTIVNAFTLRKVPSFPAEPFPFLVFGLLTDGLGDANVDVVISRLDTMEDLLQRSAAYQFTNPLAILQVTLRVRDFSFPAPGRYQVAIRIQDEPIAHCNIRLSE